MKLRMYRQEDCKEVTELFYHTVHTINEKDYTKEQLDVCPCRVSEQRSSHCDLRNSWRIRYREISSSMHPLRQSLFLRSGAMWW